LVFAEDAPSDVVVLTQANFDESIKTGDWLLEFYAPWCGHCKKLAPTWDLVATELKGKVGVGKVDCTVESALCKRFGVRGYPTLKGYFGSNVYDYKGDRSQADLVTFASGSYKSAEGAPLPAAVAADPPKAEAPKIVEVDPNAPSDVVILTDANFDEKLSKGGNWLLEFYAPWCGHCKKLAPTWEQLATQLKGKINVAKVDCTTEMSTCSKRFGIRGYPTVKYYADGKLFDYKGDRSLDHLTKFANEEYKNGESAPFPVAPSAAEKVQDQTAQTVKNIENQLKDKIWFAMAAVFVLGLLIGKLVLGGRSRPAPQAQPAPHNVKQE